MSNREESIERLKTEFISLAAHQLRTPLSAVKWILGELLDGEAGKLNKKQAKLIRQGYQSNERMIHLINDLLYVAEIEEGKFLKNESYQSIEMLIENVIAGHKKKIKDKKIKIVFKKQSDPLPEIKIDAEKIKLVIGNMLNNAIEYSKTGGKVMVSVQLDEGRIKIMIKDMGIGIPKDEQDRLFNKFFRASNAIKIDTTGTGLGLFICKNIIDAHKGKIFFESKKNKGSTFGFELPIKVKSLKSEN